MDGIETGSREYSIAEKGEAILAVDMGKPVKAVAKERGIPYSNVRRWVREREELGFSVLDSAKIIKERWADEVAGIFEDCMEIIGKANKRVIEDLPNASASQAAVVFGIYHDKVERIRAMASASGESAPGCITHEEQVELIRAAYMRIAEEPIDAEFEVIGDVG
jgi:transposase-like protein